MPIRIAVIGAGEMGRHHVRILSELPECKLIGIADPRPLQLQAMKNLHGVAGVTDVRTLYAEKPDAVVIAVPTTLHEATGLEALRNNLHVLMEKPIAHTSLAAEKLIREAKKRQRVLMVGFVERFNPAVIALKAALKNEKTISIDITRVGPLPPRIKDVGIITDLAIHDLDLIRYLSNSVPTEIHAAHERIIKEHEDIAMILMRLKNGTMAHITTNWLTPTKARTIQVATRRGYYRADLLEKKVWKYSHPNNPTDDFKLTELPVKNEEPLKNELLAFLKAIRTGKEPAVTGMDGLVALKDAEQCLKQGQKKK